MSITKGFLVLTDKGTGNNLSHIDGGIGYLIHKEVGNRFKSTNQRYKCYTGFLYWLYMLFLVKGENFEKSKHDI